jgi:undecaprenyl phosphate-alpha-L-ara4FN deformylase
MKTLVLKIDVDTLRGTLKGVPRLLSQHQTYGIPASFLFSLGPDHTGRAIKRVFRKGFLGKVSRTSVVQHYGLRTLLYGTLLPGPDIGLRAAPVMRAVRDAGFEVGIHTWDHIAWQDGVSNASESWTLTQMHRAENRFSDLFGCAPRIHGAAGWQMNDAAFKQLDAAGMLISSDCRGTNPFIPVINGVALRCPQLPTTLPTLDELIGLEGVTEDTVAQRVLEMTEQCPPQGHVFTLHAELEGMRLNVVYDKLLQGWQRQGYRFMCMGEKANTLDIQNLPRCTVIYGELAGRSGTLALQGPPRI